MNKWWLTWLAEEGASGLEEGTVAQVEPPTGKPTDVVVVGDTTYEAYIKKAGNEVELTVCIKAPGAPKQCLARTFSAKDVRFWRFKAMVDDASDTVLEVVQKCGNPTEADMINSNLQYAIWELEKLGVYLLSEPELWSSPERIERRIERHWSEYEEAVKRALSWAEGCDISPALNAVYRLADAVKQMVEAVRRKAGVRA